MLSSISPTLKSGAPWGINLDSMKRQSSRKMGVSKWPSTLERKRWRHQHQMTSSGRRLMRSHLTLRSMYITSGGKRGSLCSDSTTSNSRRDAGGSRDISCGCCSFKLRILKSIKQSENSGNLWVFIRKKLPHIHREMHSLNKQNHTSTEKIKDFYTKQIEINAPSLINWAVSWSC